MWLKQEIGRWSSRENVPKYVKYKKKPDGSHLVNYKQQKDYEYYKCDYCGEEIVIKDKADEQDGGIAILPNTITNRGNIKIALHNRCLKPLLREAEKEV
ncbi:MAG: hypothetical protein HFJ60_08025 [Clostridia bacterium]|jgi:DNA-directed RNA polymerase subunit RPC12/RpoP|nr:hypothetical protein [Clostridia bacterium]